MDFDQTWMKGTVAQYAKKIAKRCGAMKGGDISTHIRCFHRHLPTGTKLLFTYDVGMHSSGWWKNPDYERCMHLSLSFVDPVTGAYLDKDDRLTREWCEAFFGSDVDKLWCEPPHSSEGKGACVWHYRLFCDPSWSPIVPRGEVYSTEFTEAGWKSWSDAQEAIRKNI